MNGRLLSGSSTYHHSGAYAMYVIEACSTITIAMTKARRLSR